jgi:hypothetical protein
LSGPITHQHCATNGCTPPLVRGGTCPHRYTPTSHCTRVHRHSSPPAVLGGQLIARWHPCDMPPSRAICVIWMPNPDHLSCKPFYRTIPPSEHDPCVGRQQDTCPCPSSPKAPVHDLCAAVSDCAPCYQRFTTLRIWLTPMTAFNVSSGNSQSLACWLAYRRHCYAHAASPSSHT